MLVPWLPSWGGKGVAALGPRTWWACAGLDLVDDDLSSSLELLLGFLLLRRLFSKTA